MSFFGLFSPYFGPTEPSLLYPPPFDRFPNEYEMYDHRMPRRPLAASGVRTWRGFRIEGAVASTTVEVIAIARVIKSTLASNTGWSERNPFVVATAEEGTHPRCWVVHLLKRGLVTSKVVAPLDRRAEEANV